MKNRSNAFSPPGATDGGSRRWFTLVIAAAIGAAAAIPAIAATLNIIEPGVPSVLGLHHNPPMFAEVGSHVPLEVGGVCGGAEIPGPVPCSLSGFVAVRSQGDASWQYLPLGFAEGDEDLLGAVLDGTATAEAGVLEYFFEVSDQESGAHETLPIGGAGAPATLTIAAVNNSVELSGFLFPTNPENAVFSALWGEGIEQVGYEPGNESTPTAPSSFDVDQDGRIVVYDAANQRIVIQDSAGERTLIESPTAASLVDVAIAGTDSVYLLELSPGGDSDLDVFWTSGTSSEVLHLGSLIEDMADQLRITPLGIAAHQYPSDQWRLVVDPTRGSVDPGHQLIGGRAGKTAQDGTELVLKVTETYVQVGSTGETDNWSLRITGPNRFGEGQLAEVLRSGDIGIVVREITESGPYFRVVRVTKEGAIISESVVPTGDWTDSAPVSRFRVSPDGRLYQLRTSADMFEIVEVDW